MPYAPPTWASILAGGIAGAPGFNYAGFISTVPLALALAATSIAPILSRAPRHCPTFSALTSRIKSPYAIKQSVSTDIRKAAVVVTKLSFLIAPAAIGIREAIAPLLIAPAEPPN
jgi:hypothetical protein